jgi:CubicO group peptidase (beta-lactamase class C family)
MAGAAALYSNALDIGAWLKLHLGRGRFGGRQIISDTSMREMHTPLVVSSVGNFRGLINRYASVVGFGIGWHISDYRGRKVLENVGIFGGYTQYIVLVPDHNLGFAIMANLAPALPLRDAIQDLKFALLDIAIGPTAPALRRSP